MHAGGDAPVPDRPAREGRTGVARGVARGVAQEFQRVFTATTYHCDEGGGGSAEPSPAKIICVTGKPLFGHAGPPP
jgi:hypothetical protein